MKRWGLVMTGRSFAYHPVRPSISVPFFVCICHWAGVDLSPPTALFTSVFLGLACASSVLSLFCFFFRVL